MMVIAGGGEQKHGSARVTSERESTIRIQFIFGATTVISSVAASIITNRHWFDWRIRLYSKYHKTDWASLSILLLHHSEDDVASLHTLQFFAHNILNKKISNLLLHEHMWRECKKNWENVNKSLTFSQANLDAHKCQSSSLSRKDSSSSDFPCATMRMI